MRPDKLISFEILGLDGAPVTITKRAGQMTPEDWRAARDSIRRLIELKSDERDKQFESIGRSVVKLLEAGADPKTILA